jgi:hypothetical protein
MLSQKRNQYYQRQKEARIEWAMDHLSIDTIDERTFASVPSTSGSSEMYEVDIDESGRVAIAGKCTCPGYATYGCNGCIHVLTVNAFYERIQALLHPAGTYDAAGMYTPSEAVEKIAARRSTTPVDLAVVRTFKQEDAYEQLAESKDPWAGLSEDEKVTAMGHYLMGIGA